MRIATWNLWWRFGDADARRPAIEATLAASKADIIGLQEVWVRDGTDLASSIAQGLGFESTFAASPHPEHFHKRGHEEFGVGNAVLSRWPIVQAETVALPVGDERNEGRVAATCLVDTPAGTVRVANAHLNSGWWHNATREMQLRHIVTWLADQAPADLPAILLGDFNAAPDFDELRPLTGRRTAYDNRLPLLDAWEFARPGDPGVTWDLANPHSPGEEPSCRIDYVFVGTPRPDGIGRIDNAERFGIEPVEGVVPSDHYGVAVDLRTEPDQPST